MRTSLSRDGMPCRKGRRHIFWRTYTLSNFSSWTSYTTILSRTKRGLRIWLLSWRVDLLPISSNRVTKDSKKIKLKVRKKNSTVVKVWNSSNKEKVSNYLYLVALVLMCGGSSSRFGKGDKFLYPFQLTTKVNMLDVAFSNIRRITKQKHIPIIISCNR